MKRQKSMKRVRNFSKDQGGMEALQAVSLVAISAIVMIAVATGGNSASKWMQDAWGNLVDTPDAVKITNSGGGTGGGGGIGAAARDVGGRLSSLLE